MNIIKKLIIKTASFFRIYINYDGFRIETISLIRDICRKDRSSPEEKEESEEKEEPDRKGYVFCLGDSNTFGWNYPYKDSFPAILGQKLNENRRNKIFEVLNLGKGGSKIEDLDMGIINFFQPGKNNASVLNYGLNDALLENIIKNYFDKNKSNINWEELNAGDFAGDAEEFANKYKNILNKLFETNERIIIVGLYRIKKIRTINQLNPTEKYLNLQNDILDLHNRKLMDIAWDTGADFIDLWTILDDAENNTDYLYKDGLHLNKKAFEVIAEKINDILLK